MPGSPHNGRQTSPATLAQQFGEAGAVKPGWKGTVDRIADAEGIVGTAFDEMSPAGKFSTIDEGIAAPTVSGQIEMQAQGGEPVLRGQDIEVAITVHVDDGRNISFGYRERGLVSILGKERGKARDKAHRIAVKGIFIDQNKALFVAAEQVVSSIAVVVGHEHPGRTTTTIKICFVLRSQSIADLIGALVVAIDSKARVHPVKHHHIFPAIPVHVHHRNLGIVHPARPGIGQGFSIEVRDRDIVDRTKVLSQQEKRKGRKAQQK